MFTGIITAKAQVNYAQQLKEGMKVGFKTPEGWGDLEMGESIAVNGVCLTIDSITSDEWTAFLMPETLAVTSFGRGMPTMVNMERALPLSHRLSGHIVQGHVDGTGTVTQINKDDGYVLSIEFDGQYAGLIIHKGSVTIDGVSLTISACHGNVLEVSLIPLTLSETTLGDLQIGDLVNLEYDVIGKYVANILKQENHAKN
jgi:riboflavin synthase